MAELTQGNKALPEAFTPEYLRQLELLRIRARRAFLGTKQGGHVSLKRGHGIEFSDFRQYQPGDDPRHIDWSVFARSERLYVKQFQEEQDLTVLLLIDSTASMVTPSNEKKWRNQGVHTTIPNPLVWFPLEKACTAWPESRSLFYSESHLW